jgi:arsenate reductase (thioredoxin)
MAQAFLRSFDQSIEVYSAGTYPAARVNQRAILVMQETGIDISNNIPVNVDLYLNVEWDYVITVCDEANEACPYFSGIVKHRIHFAFEDPSNVTGTEEFIMSEFRRIRDEIKKEFHRFYCNNLM